MMHGREKSDSAIIAAKPPNGAGLPAEEGVERRAGAEGNAGQDHTHRAQERESVSQGLDRVRHVARTRKKERFTALLHHVDVERLRAAYSALKRDAAPGVDGITWCECRVLEMEGQFLVAQLPVLLEQRTAQYRLSGQAVPSRLLNPIAAQVRCTRPD